MAESCSQKMLQLQSFLPPNAEDMRETRKKGKPALLSWSDKPTKYAFTELTVVCANT